MPWKLCALVGLATVCEAFVSTPGSGLWGPSSSAVSEMQAGAHRVRIDYGQAYDPRNRPHHVGLQQRIDYGVPYNPRSRPWHMENSEFRTPYEVSYKPKVEHKQERAQLRSQEEKSLYDGVLLVKIYVDLSSKSGFSKS